MSAPGPAFYDEAILDPESPHLADAHDSVYAGLFDAVVELLGQKAPAHLVDLGCGTGRFASLVLPHTGRTLSYVGYDFSAGMIDQARAHNAEHVTGIERGDWTGTVAFEQQDLRDLEPADLADEATPEPLTLLMLEVLEHLDNDLRLLGRLPVDARLILSIPSFDSAAHVRWFPNPADAIARYSEILDLNTWQRIWLPEHTGYFHLLEGRLRP